MNFLVSAIKNFRPRRGFSKQGEDLGEDLGEGEDFAIKERILLGRRGNEERGFLFNDKERILI